VRAATGPASRRPILSRHPTMALSPTVRMSIVPSAVTGFTARVIPRSPGTDAPPPPGAAPARLRGPSTGKALRVERRDDRVATRPAAPGAPRRGRS
jgi:hypothetical protein